MAYEEAISRIEVALCERYNVSSVPEPLDEMVALARSGDLSAIEEAVAEREFYRWGPVIAEALAEAKASKGEPVAEATGVVMEVIEVEPDGTVSEPIEGDGTGEALPPVEEPEPVNEPEPVVEEAPKKPTRRRSRK